MKVCRCGENQDIEQHDEVPNGYALLTAHVDGEYLGTVNHRTTSDHQANPCSEEEASENRDQDLVICYCWLMNKGNYNRKCGNADNTFNAKTLSDLFPPEYKEWNIQEKDQDRK